MYSLVSANKGWQNVSQKFEMIAKIRTMQRGKSFIRMNGLKLGMADGGYERLGESPEEPLLADNSSDQSWRGNNLHA